MQEADAQLRAAAEQLLLPGVRTLPGSVVVTLMQVVTAVALQRPSMLGKVLPALLALANQVIQSGKPCLGVCSALLTNCFTQCACWAAWHKSELQRSVKGSRPCMHIVGILCAELEAHNPAGEVYQTGSKCFIHFK